MKNVIAGVVLVTVGVGIGMAAGAGAARAQTLKQFLSVSGMEEMPDAFTSGFDRASSMRINTAGVILASGSAAAEVHVRRRTGREVGREPWMDTPFEIILYALVGAARAGRGEC